MIDIICLSFYNMSIILCCVKSSVKNISLTVLSVNCHDVTGRIFDR